MTQSYTINREKSQPLLQRLVGIPGVRHVAILDAAGLCLSHTGHEPVSTMLLTDWTVVARAAFSACDDLGQRCGSGPCQESLQTHREGGTLMRALTGNMLMIVQFEQRTSVSSLRLAVAEVALELPTPIEYRPPTQRMQRSSPEFSSSNDPFGTPNWWAEQKAAAQKIRAQPEIVEADVL